MEPVSTRGVRVPTSDASPRSDLRLLVVGVGYFSLFLLPVILATLTFPFSWMDHLTAISLYLQYGCCSFSAVLPNFYWNLFRGAYVRPTAASLYTLQYTLFGGEFWLWFLVRWLVTFGTVGLAVTVLRQMRAGRAARWVVAAMLLFHPAAVPVYLFTADILVALGALATFAVVLAGAPEGKWAFDLSRLPVLRYGALLLVWFLTLGTKEVAIVFCALVVLGFTLWSRPSLAAAGRLFPFYLALAVTAWRLYVTSSGVVGPLTPRIFLNNLVHHLRFLEVPSPFHLLGAASVLLFLLAVVRVAAASDSAARRVSLVSIAAAAGMLLMTSTISRPNLGFSTRYVIPSLFLLSLPIGMAWNTLPRWSAYLAPAVVIALPFLEASDLYSQTLAYQQRLYNQSDTLAVLQAKRDQGYRLAVAHDSTFEGEYGRSIIAFFGEYGKKFYDEPESSVVYSFPSPTPIAEPFALLTAVGPDAFRQTFDGQVDMATLTDVETVPLEDHGLLNKILRKFLTLDTLIRNEHFPYYDPIGAPQLRQGGSDYFVYSFGRPPAALPAVDRIDTLDLRVTIEGKSHPGTLRKGEVVEVTASPGAPFIISVAIGSPPAGTGIEFLGEYRVTGDRVFLGVSDDLGHDLWNTLIRPSETPRPLPPVPALPFSPGRQYVVFCYGPPGPGRLTLRNVGGLRFRTVHMVQPAKRFGAVTR